MHEAVCMMGQKQHHVLLPGFRTAFCLAERPSTILVLHYSPLVLCVCSLKTMRTTANIKLYTFLRQSFPACLLGKALCSFLSVELFQGTVRHRERPNGIFRLFHSCDFTRCPPHQLDQTEATEQKKEFFLWLSGCLSGFRRVEKFLVWLVDEVFKVRAKFFTLQHFYTYLRQRQE